jgi:hypothetical protein
MEAMNLHISELKKAFFSRNYIRKTDLRNFYRIQSAELSENRFRRILYALEKKDLIRQVDIGIYVLGYEDPGLFVKKKFVPTFSDELSDLNSSIKTAFPYAKFLTWETRSLHEFMLHQPGQNQIILETEREVTESVFNYIGGVQAGKVFLQPDRLIVERYILPQSDSIIVSSSITQSPKQKVGDIFTPKLEKLLVDIFADDEKFYTFHGEELVHIFETAFERYRLSEKTLFRYAERRKAGKRIRAFIEQETDIRLSSLRGGAWGTEEPPRGGLEGALERQRH